MPHRRHYVAEFLICVSVEQQQSHVKVPVCVAVLEIPFARAAPATAVPVLLQLQLATVAAPATAAGTVLSSLEQLRAASLYAETVRNESITRDTSLAIAETRHDTLYKIILYANRWRF